jgi:hypothetical protein
MALADAMALSNLFDFEIVLVHAKDPRANAKEIRAKMDVLLGRVATAGYPCKAIRGSGDIAGILRQYPKSRTPIF